MYALLSGSSNMKALVVSLDLQSTVLDPVDIVHVHQTIKFGFSCQTMLP